MQDDSTSSMALSQDIQTTSYSCQRYTDILDMYFMTFGSTTTAHFRFSCFTGCWMHAYIHNTVLSPRLVDNSAKKQKKQLDKSPDGLAALETSMLTKDSNSSLFNFW